jgi:hypothetical protein
MRLNTITPLLVAGFMILLNSPAAQATFTLGSLSASVAATENMTVGAALTTGTLDIGGSAQTGTISIGAGTGAQIVNLGTGATGAKTINMGTGAVANAITIGTTTGAASMAINSGTGDMILWSIDDISLLGGSAGSVINVGTNTHGNAINIGTDNTAADTIVMGSALDDVDLAGEDITLTSADDVAILVGGAGGILNLATGTEGYAINVGTNNTTLDTIIIGSALDNVDLAGEDIALTSADDIHILGGSAGSIINVGTNVDGNAINIGTDNTAADTIILGSALDNVDLAGEDIAFTSADDLHLLGGSAGSIINIGTNVDGNVINVGTDNTAADTIVIGSALDNVDLAGEDITLTSADDVAILVGGAGGILNLATGTEGYAINVGTNNTTLDTIIIGSALDNVDLAGEDIALTSADDIHILGGSAGSIINVGTNVDGNVINIGTDNTAADTINIGSALDTVNIVGATLNSTGGAFDISAAGALTLGDTNATSVSICNSAACDTLTLGTNADADAITLGDSLDNVDLAGEDIALTSADDIHILGGSAGSIINVGTNVDGNAINIGTDNTAADTIIIGSALDNVDVAGEDIAFASADDIHILSSSAAGIINVGTGPDGYVFNIATDNSAADDVNVGSALDDVDVAGEDIALTSADDLHLLGGSAGSIINIGTNVDGNAINIGTDNTAADTIVIGSALDAVSITDDNWGITAAGAANFASFQLDGAGGTMSNFLTETTASLDIAAAGSTACSTAVTDTVTGAALGDTVLVAPSADDAAWDEGQLTAWVSAADTVSIIYCADDTGGNPADMTYEVMVFQN